MFWIGYFAGSLYSGKKANEIGRKKMIINGSAMLVLHSFLLSITPNSAFLITLIKLLQGFGFGCTLPITYLLAGEILPTHLRGRGCLALVLLEMIGRQYTFYITNKLFVSPEEVNYSN